jgi:hypothetical protein
VVMSKAAQLVQIFCPSSKQLMDATFWSCGFALKAICGSGEVSVDRLQRVTVVWWPGWTAIEGIEQTRECIHEHPNKPHRIAIALAEANEPIEWSSQLGVLLIHDWKLPQAGSGGLFGGTPGCTSFSPARWPGQRQGLNIAIWMPWCASAGHLKRGLQLLSQE